MADAISRARRRAIQARGRVQALSRRAQAPTEERGSSRGPQLVSADSPLWDQVDDSGSQWQATAELWQRMERDDEISAVLQAIELPIMGAEWSVVPPADPSSAAEGRREQEVADAMQRALLHDLRDGWQATLRDMLSAVPLGHSVMEQVWAPSDDAGGRMVPERLRLRPSISLSRADLDASGEVTAVYQETGDGEVGLERDRLVMAVIRGRGISDWRGRGLLRGAHRPWLMRDRLDRIMLTAAERWGAGIPFARAPSDVPDGGTEWEDAESTLSELHSSERSYLVYPDGWEVGVLDRRGTIVDIDSSIARLGVRIARSMLALHLAQGGGEFERGGAKSIGEILVDLFLSGCRAWAGVVADAVTRDTIVPCCGWSWPGVRPPRLVARNITSGHLDRIGYLIQTGAMRPSRVLDQYLYGAVGVEAPSPDDESQWGDRQGGRQGESGDDGQQRDRQMSTTSALWLPLAQTLLETIMAGAREGR